MKTLSPPHQAVSLAPALYFQLVHTLTDLLPPPLDPSPEALRTRNLAAIAKVAALLPVNANETDLAAQCIAARGQAEDVLRLLRENADDIPLTIRLNAQYASMVRTSLASEARLMRVQAVRQKRDAIEAAVDQDARTRQVVERCMLVVADPDFEHRAASPEAVRDRTPEAAREETSAAASEEVPEAPPEAALASAPEAAPEDAPVAALTPHGSRQTEENVSEFDMNSHDVAFETWMSEQPWNQEPGRTGETDLRRRIREAMTEALLAGRALPANGRESPGGTG